MVKEYVTRDIKLETIRLSIVQCSEMALAAIKEKVISECSAWWGLRRQSAQELITQLVNDEQIFDDDGDLWTLERWNKIKDAHERDYLKGGKIIQITFKEAANEDGK